MLAVDTNVVVRLLTGDDPEQFAQARRLFYANTIFIPITVLLEVEWVLRGAYRKPKDEVLAALKALAGLPQVSLEDADRAATAMRWAEQGIDFADALHLARSEACETFVTFDQRFVRLVDGEAVRDVEAWLAVGETPGP